MPLLSTNTKICQTVHRRLHGPQVEQHPLPTNILARRLLRSPREQYCPNRRHRRRRTVERFRLSISRNVPTQPSQYPKQGLLEDRQSDRGRRLLRPLFRDSVYVQINYQRG